MLQAARRADAYVLVTCRLLVHATVRNAVLAQKSSPQTEH